MESEPPRCRCGRPRRVAQRYQRRDGSTTIYYGKDCAACWMREYRKRPAARRANQEAVKRYAAAHPEKRRQWNRTWRARTGWYNPDLTALRRAIKAVEQAVAQTKRRQGVRGTGQ